MDTVRAKVMARKMLIVIIYVFKLCQNIGINVVGDF